MQSITLTFTEAATGHKVHPDYSIFWLIVFALCVLDDEKRREKKRRRKLERAAVLATPKPPCPGPR